MAGVPVCACLLLSLLIVILVEQRSLVQSAACGNVQQGVVLGVGADVRHGSCASQEECCATCDAAGDCVAWTYHSSGPFANVCLQHSSASPQRKDSTAVSGLAGPFRGAYVGCFKDFVPAPGVPPVRALAHFNGSGAPAEFGVEPCVTACRGQGYQLAGVTTSATVLDRGGFGGKGSEVDWCYCDCDVNQAAPPVVKSLCGNGTGFSPGEAGALAVYRVTAANPPPATDTCPSGSLPPGPACSQAAAQKWPFCNTSLPLDDRISDLVDRITLQEAGPLLTARQSPAVPRLGIPAFYWGTNAIHGVARVANAACATKSDNKTKVCATSFPQALNIGSTFNRSIMKAVGFVIGKEMRALTRFNGYAGGVGLTSWAPTINIIRDPRWGRNQETVSEDPYLAGEYAAAFSSGLQFGVPTVADQPFDPRFLLGVATLKHLAGYSLEDWSPSGNYTDHTYTRQTFNANISARDLNDTYLPAFQSAVVNGGAAGVMYACNELNGVPPLASSFLNGKLESWGFDGYRTTDGGQIGQTVSAHHWKPTVEDVIGYALADGQTDISDGSEFIQSLVETVAEGKTNLSMVQRALFNTFKIRFRLGVFHDSFCWGLSRSNQTDEAVFLNSMNDVCFEGLFDPPNDQPYANISADDINDEFAQQLNSDAAHQSLVLLQNDGPVTVLPFKLSVLMNGAEREPLVAVIGPLANSSLVLEGSYGRSMKDSDFPSLIDTIRSTVEESVPGASTEFAPGVACSKHGCSDLSPDPQLLVEATALANRADIVVVMVGLQSISDCIDPNGDCGYEAEQHDRFSIGLPAPLEELTLAILSNNDNETGHRANNRNKTAVVLVHGGGLAVEKIKENAAAILDAHYPGAPHGAQAITNALFGR
eukprot:INCI5908.12.p1 GENE.INCI5908.12~~INCI5908.12.p1  ORF type:complete len:877 (+),score=138.79 INCI5908.12:217-2847(+)